MDFVLMEEDEDSFTLSKRGDALVAIIFAGQLSMKLADLIYFEFILPKKLNKVNLTKFSAIVIASIFGIMGWSYIYQIKKGDHDDKEGGFKIITPTLIFSSLLAFFIQISRNTIQRRVQKMIGEAPLLHTKPYKHMPELDKDEKTYERRLEIYSRQSLNVVTAQSFFCCIGAILPYIVIHDNLGEKDKWDNIVWPIVNMNLSILALYAILMSVVGISEMCVPYYGLHPLQEKHITYLNRDKMNIVRKKVINKKIHEINIKYTEQSQNR